MVTSIVLSIVADVQSQQQSQQSQQPFMLGFSGERRMLLREGLGRIYTEDSALTRTYAAFYRVPCITAGFLSAVEHGAKLPPRVCLMLGLALFLGLSSSFSNSNSTGAGATTAMQQQRQQHATKEAHAYLKRKLEEIAAARKPVFLPEAAPLTTFIRDFLNTKGPNLQLPNVAPLFVSQPLATAAKKSVPYVPQFASTPDHPAALLYRLGPTAKPLTQIFTTKKPLTEEDVAQIMEVIVR